MKEQQYQQRLQHWAEKRLPEQTTSDGSRIILVLRTYQELARLRAHGIPSFSILALAFYLAKISITNAIPPKSCVQICGCAVAKVPLLARPLLFSDITVPENRSCVSPQPFSWKNVPLDDADDASYPLFHVTSCQGCVAPFLIEQSSTDSFPAQKSVV